MRPPHQKRHLLASLFSSAGFGILNADCHVAEIASSWQTLNLRSALLGLWAKMATTPAYHITYTTVTFFGSNDLAQALYKDGELGDIPGEPGGTL